MVAKHYDVILAGGGAAGLSLAYRLVQGLYRDARLLIVDEQVKAHNDHTWRSWLREDDPFDAIAYRAWTRLAFVAPDFRRRGGPDGAARYLRRAHWRNRDTMSLA
ncbi:MAG: hypothetical protein JXB35_15260 [Anaerolineae bacterium]|nr:hypothetical protein [Anaerolineae bacterium]